MLKTLLEKYTSREFLLTGLMALAALGVALGWWGEGLSKELAAQLATVLAAVFAAVRTFQKHSENKADAEVAKAGIEAGASDPS